MNHVTQNTKLRIVFVTSEYVTESNFDGGLSNYLHRVCLALQKLEHEPVIVVSSYKDEVFFYQGIEVYRVKILEHSSFLRRNYLLAILNKITINLLENCLYLIIQNWKLNSRLRKIHKIRPFSIIQYPSCGGIGIFRLKHIPSVVRISGYLPVWHDSYQIKRTLDIKITEKMEEIAYFKADSLFAPSYLNAQYVEKIVRKDVAIIETPFILDIAKQNYDYKIFNTHLINKKYLLFFGTIGLLKGCGLIRDIIFDLFQRNSNIYFVFVGKSKNHLGYQKGIDIMDQIKQAASSYLNRVIHFDPLSHDQLYPIIENSYAVVLPSIIDNFPNTCLEAMAHKRVVIGANGSSFEQLIDNGINGFLFQKGNARDLLKVIEIALLLSNKERSLIGEKAYERILKLQPEIVVNQLIDFYKQTIINFNSTLIKNQNK